MTLHVDPSIDPVEHVTSFEYRSLTSGVALVAVPLILDKTKVEPDSTDPGTRLDTAYDYDSFGNIVTTTSCANDFDACTAGAVGPNPSPPDPAHLPFRTTSVSYNQSAFVPASGIGLTTTLPYGDGRFPVLTTNAVGHKEYTVYDPNTGLLKEKTGPNGITLCRGYDSIGNQTSETQRCGIPIAALTTTTHRYYFNTGGGTPSTQIATVVTGPDRNSSREYSDRLDARFCRCHTRSMAVSPKLPRFTTAWDACTRCQSRAWGTCQRAQPCEQSRRRSGPRPRLLDDDSLRRDRVGSALSQMIWVTLITLERRHRPS